MSTPQRQLEAVHAVTRVLNGATSLVEAAPRVLQTLATALGFTGAAWWRVDAQTKQLQPFSGWRSEKASSGEARNEACASGKPSWWPDGTVAFPVVCGSERLGVIELLTQAPKEPREGLLLTVASIGEQLGQFVDRHGTRQLQQLFENVPFPITVMRGRELVYELNNAAAAALIDHRPVIGRSMFDVFPELEQQPLAVQPALEVLRTGATVVLPEHPVPFVSPEGAVVERYFTNTLQPLRDATGAVTHVVTVGVEVTDQVHSRRRVEEVANAVPEIVWTVSPEGQTDFFNRRWYEYTGLAPGLDQLAAFTAACHPDDVHAVRTAWTNSAATGTPYEVELRLRRADGAWRWHLARCVPLTGAGGKIIKWVGSSTDIDDHKRAEETSKLLAQASVLLNSSLDFEATLQTIAKLAVPKVADWCSVHLQSEGEALPRQLVVAHVDPMKVQWAKELQRIFPPDPDAKTGAIAVIRTGQAEFYPDIPDAMLVAVAKNDEQLRVLREIGFSSAMTVPLSAHGRTFGCISLVRAESRTRYTHRDLAAAKELAGLAAAAVANARLYRDAQRAIKVRDEFLAVASHELKTPLTPLQLQVQSLQKLGRGVNEDVSPRIVSKLDVIGRQVGRMERLINSMLDVSRVTSHGLELDLKPLDLSAVAREVGERLRAEQGGEDAPVVVDAPKPVVGMWDPLRVDQIVANLLSNAMKFGEGKPIEVEVREAGDSAELVVRDHGIGIAPQDHQRIFDRFERAVATTNYGGLGLGLWITRELVDRLGGSIRVASAPGEGSTFIVLLPKEQPPVTVRRAPARDEELSH